ncbi:MAG: DUF4374 domain-containing protein [Rikenellaceae bacterium]|nr:DUF4374 domain-containing protein [Rikenellaceae bacterium]
MKRSYLLKGLAALAIVAMILSCDDENGDEPTPNPGGGDVSSYVISATVTVGESSSNYLIPVDDLTRGSVTTVNNGRETETGTYWVYYGVKYLYRLVYNKGEAGVSTSYVLNSEGKTSPRSNTYEIKRFTSYGFYDDYLITTSTGDLNDSNAENISGNDYIPKGFLINYIDVENQTIKSNTTEIWAENYFGDGEFVTFAGVEQVGSRIFTAPIPMGMSHYGVVVYENLIAYPDLVKTESGGTGSAAYTAGELQWTQYPDQAYIAIYPNMNFDPSERILIKTDKISYAAGRSASQYYQMVWAADNGDLYVFSPGYAKRMSDSRQQTTLPAGVVRIKNGENDFDSGYYYNLESQSGGCGFLCSWHIADDYFMLLMYDAQFEGGEDAPSATSLAIFKGETGKLTYVTGLPSSSTIASIGTMPYFEDGVAYIPILETGEDPAVYAINAATATASKGISVSATTITSVGKLSYYQ